MHVFVLSVNGKPLMPTTQAKARKLLRDEKAVIVGYKPFTIQLTYKTKTEIVQPITIGVDTGAKFIGIAVETEGKIIAKGEIELRTDVSKLLTLRRLLRRARRSRKLRYRPKRFNNRARPEGWLPPSIQSRVDNTIMWIEKFRDVLPNPKIIVEVGKFDVNQLKITNGDSITKENELTGRYYVFARDNYTCQKCKKKNVKFRVHHIIFRSNGGTDEPDNLITLCLECHGKVHKGEFFIKGIKFFPVTEILTILTYLGNASLTLQF